MLKIMVKYLNNNFSLCDKITRHMQKSLTSTEALALHQAALIQPEDR